MTQQLHVDRRIYEIKRDFGLPFSSDSKSKEEAERPTASPEPKREPAQPVGQPAGGPSRGSKSGTSMKAPIEIDPPQAEEPLPAPTLTEPPREVKSYNLTPPVQIFFRAKMMATKK